MFGIICLTVVLVFVNSAQSTDGLNVCQVVRPFVPFDTIEILPYKFAYDYGEELNMILSLTDVCEEITAVRLKTTSGGIERIICLSSPEDGFFHIQGPLEDEVSIVMEIYTNSIDFPVKCVLELSGGKDRSFFEWNTNRCKEPPCLLKISLHEYCTGGVVGACVVAFLVYVWMRQRCNKPDAQATMELNTYSTANPVLYADLEFARPSNTNRVHIEEPYAQVIGVLKPTKT
ncbi:hypothetical protein B5X24_HaOG204707 [Helicoverpa armigera]|uniref:Uncharacterized protein n=1 Tax=Helicoverpa armigera TaxID=29058 RepID=A0A2W1BN82_HELAM|nr:hypothetical protein B5X24_HaOG204707 [Helicoverpa armigera]